MKAADLKKASDIAAMRASNIAMRDRLLSNDRLRLSIGETNTAGEIVLAPAYLATLRADLVKALDLKISENDAALLALGVEP